LAGPEETFPFATCPPQFPQEIDSISWDEVDRRTGYKEMKKLKESNLESKTERK
jgi:hypothetical protein